MSEQASSKGLASRLAAYGAVAAGALSGSAASADVIGQDGLNIVVTAGNQFAIDFGGSFGERFVFSVASNAGGGTFRTTYSNGGSYASQSTMVYQRSFFLQRRIGLGFAAGGGWTGGSIVAYAPGSSYVQRMGNGFVIGDPVQPFGEWGNLGSGFIQGYYVSNYFRSVRTGYGGGYTVGPYYNSSSFGSWAGGRRGFLGFRFTDNGTDYHYGWIDISTDRSTVDVVIHGWGLETTPNAGIEVGVTPAPASALALLAMGAAGLGRTRRDAALKN